MTRHLLHNGNTEAIPGDGASKLEVGSDAEDDDDDEGDDDNEKF